MNTTANTQANIQANITPTAAELAMIAEIRAKQAAEAEKRNAEMAERMSAAIEKEMKVIAAEDNIYSGLYDFGVKIYNDINKLNAGYEFSTSEQELPHEVTYYIDRNDPEYNAGEHSANKRIYWKQPNTRLIPRITKQGAGRNFEVRFFYEKQKYGNGVDYYCMVHGLAYPDCDRKRKAAASIDEKITGTIAQMERAANVKQIREDGIRFLTQWASNEFTNSEKVTLHEYRDEAPYVEIHFANKFRIKYGFQKSEHGFHPRLIGAVTIAMNQQDLINLFIK